MKQNKCLYTLIALLMLVFNFSACSPDEFELGGKDLTSDDLVEGIAYTITHDEDNPNTVYLTSLLPPSYNVTWEHPQGRSQARTVTLNMPFAGTYEVTFGVETRGGVVYGPTTTFTVDDFCADFVTDEMWTMLSGGVDNSKRWFLDLDANGTSRYFAGPVYFYGTDDSWETVTNGAVIEGDTWSWQADWASVAGWQFSSTAMDFGYMEFDLKGNSNVTVVMNELGREMKGVYMLNTTDHTITFTNAELLHDAVNDTQVASWSGTMKLLSLTENTMQIGVERVSDPCLLVFNFISEDYYNNWDPNSGTEEVITPTLMEGWRNYVEPLTQKQTTFKLAEDDTPFDWLALDGSQLGYAANHSAVDYLGDLQLTFNRVDNSYTCTLPDGTSMTGTYTLSDDGIYTFSDGLPVYTMSTDGLMQFRANPDNTLRITNVAVDSYTGAISDLWLGSELRDDQNRLYQYQGYHFKLVVAGAADEVRLPASIHAFDSGWAFIDGENVYITGNGDYTFTLTGTYSSPYGIYLDIENALRNYPNFDATIKSIRVDGNNIAFDDSAIDRGTGDAATTYRRYILNPWNSAFADPSVFAFNSSLEVVITVTLDSGAPTIPTE